MKFHRKILIVAYPGSGHINPTLRLANRLLKMGAAVTFSTSISVIRRLEKETIPNGLTFAPFTDGHDNGQQPTTTLQQFVSDFASNGARGVAEILSAAASDAAPFNNLVYTPLVPWAAKLAASHNVKSTLLWCQPATTLDIYYYYFNGYENLISSNNNNLDFPINLPGLPPLTVADLPSFLLPSRPKEHDFIVQVLKEHVDAIKLFNPRVLVNTFEGLEIESIRAIDKLEFLPIGPLIPSELSEDSLGGDFFDKPEDDYIQWLNKRPKSSVVYVSFGSLATLTTEQLGEIANGLIAIGREFLWVIRDANQAAKLSKIEELKKQGMIVSWCSQVVVLSHEAIGCYVMHGGWNSTVETLMAGVPSVVFSQWSDQATNGKLIEDVWKTGVRVKKREEDGVVEGSEIERCVELVMKDDEMRRNGEKWREIARKALNNGGSSNLNLQAFLDDA